MAGDSIPPPPDTTTAVSSDAARALAILRCIIALAGTNSPLNGGLLAELANVGSVFEVFSYLLSRSHSPLLGSHSLYTPRYTALPCPYLDCWISRRPCRPRA